MKGLKLTAVILTICALLSSCGEPPKSAAERTLAKMSLEEKVWQMFFIAPEDILDNISEATQAGESTKKAITDCPVGGIVYFERNMKSPGQLIEMIAKTQSYSKIPLLISVDEEGGRVARLGRAGLIDKLPPMADIGAMTEGGEDEAIRIGEFLAAKLTELGFNMDFAPVADVITTADNADIGDRSFGTDAEKVSRLVAAQVGAMENKGLSATLKHFPSNGSATKNTHYETAVSERNAEEMRDCEFKSFKAGIDAGADAVMVAHISAHGLTGDYTPASMSEKVIQNYLRDELGFEGLVITDAMNMGAITNSHSPADAACESIKAGADMILMSPDLKNTVVQITEKVKNGEISEDKINDSVLRILKLKEKKGLLK